MYYNPVTKRGLCKTFHHPWTGPWTIVSRIAHSTDRIQEVGTRKRRVVHFVQLRPFTGSYSREPNPHLTRPTATDQPDDVEEPLGDPLSIHFMLIVTKMKKYTVPRVMPMLFASRLLVQHFAAVKVQDSHHIGLALTFNLYLFKITVSYFVCEQ